MTDRRAIVLALLVLAGFGSAGFACASSAGSAGGTGGTSAGSGGNVSGSGGTGVVPGSGGATTTGGASASGGTTSAGSGGVPGAGGSASTGGASSGGAGCVVSVDIVPGYNKLEAGPAAVLRYQGRVDFPLPAPPVWRTWRVRLAGSATPIDVTHPTGDPALIEFPIRSPGLYSIIPEVDTGVACTIREKMVPVAPPCDACFLFRVHPPPSAADMVPLQDQKIDVSQQQEITVVNGVKATFAFMDGQAQYVPSYLRVTTPSSGVVVEGYTALAPLVTPLLGTVLYEVLVVPDGERAPLTWTLSPISLANGWPVIDQGIAVSGTLSDGNGAPVVGARVVLRQGVRPSTVGVSGADGSFQLWTRDGVMSASISPPVGSGLPEANIPATPGIALPAGGDGLNLALSWARPPTAALSITPTTAQGAPATGARVRVESVADLPSVATLRVTGPGGAVATLSAQGSVRVEVGVDGAGVARFASLPLGAYQVTVAPATTGDDAVLTTVPATVSASGTSLTVPLAAPIQLEGTLSPTPLPDGVRVVARDQSASMIAQIAPAAVGSDGSYALSVAPGRTYQLIAEPVSARGLPRVVLSTVTVGRSDQTLPGIALPPVQTKIFTVLADGQRVLPDALVQVFCLAGKDNCVDPTLPLAEAVTNRAGTFTVTLPAQ